MRAILLWFISVWMLVSVPARADDASINLTVLTDSALMLPLTELAREYARTHHASVTVVVMEGQDIAQQIGQGLDANLIVTADQPLLEALNARGLVDVFGKRTIARKYDTQYRAVLVASEALEPSRAFLDYLQGDTARAVIASYGMER